MGRLKPSEVRLLILFSAVVIGLVSFFLHDYYKQSTADLDKEVALLGTQKDSLNMLRTMQTEVNEKRLWLNKNQAVALDELKADALLDNLIAPEVLANHGLAFVSNREVPSQKDAYYWAFQRTVTVDGEIQALIQWLATLQSEKDFRAIPRLHIFPPKRQEPEALRCEVTIEQRYATEEVIQMTTPGTTLTDVPMAHTAGTSVASGSTPGEAIDPAAAEVAAKATVVPPKEKAPVRLPPPAAATDAGDSSNAAAPRVRLPLPGSQTATTGRPRGGLIDDSNRNGRSRNRTNNGNLVGPPGDPTNPDNVGRIVAPVQVPEEEVIIPDTDQAPADGEFIDDGQVELPLEEGQEMVEPAPENLEPVEPGPTPVLPEAEQL